MGKDGPCLCVFDSVACGENTSHPDHRAVQSEVGTRGNIYLDLKDKCHDHEVVSLPIFGGSLHRKALSGIISWLFWDHLLALLASYYNLERFLLLSLPLSPCWMCTTSSACLCESSVTALHLPQALSFSVLNEEIIQKARAR